MANLHTYLRCSVQFCLHNTLRSHDDLFNLINDRENRFLYVVDGIITNRYYRNLWLYHIIIFLLFYYSKKCHCYIHNQMQIHNEHCKNDCITNNNKILIIYSRLQNRSQENKYNPQLH